MPIYMYIEIQYYDLLALLTYYTLLFIESYIYIALYIFAPVATHGHAPRACLDGGVNGVNGANLPLIYP
jgi:hypothetical protein